MRNHSITDYYSKKTFLKILFIFITLFVLIKSAITLRFSIGSKV